MDGQLGREKTASQPSPIIFGNSRDSAEEVRRGGTVFFKSGAKLRTLHDERKPPKIVLVAAGGMMSSAIDVDGALWLWGAVPNPSEFADSHCRNSFSITNIEKPERVRGLLGLRVYRVACGNEHIIAVVEGRDNVDPDCYAWGNNQFGQLGLGDFRDRSYPQVVKALAASVVGPILDLACGAFHTAILAGKDDQPTDLLQEPNSPTRSRHNKLGRDVIQDSTPKHYFFRTHQPMAEQLESLRNIGSPKPRVRQDSETSSSLKSTALGSSRMSSSRSLAQYAVSSRSKESFTLEGRISVCWTFGQGENGQLGQGTKESQALPAPVEGLPNERLTTVACGLFHTAVVTETGDVWVWGMEGGLGLCPNIGPPGSRSGDAVFPVRVFGESSGTCNPVSGSKGITCGAAHTVTLSNGGKDIWAWGRGQNGVLGVGHTSDCWFPCPVLWPPVSLAPWSGESKGPPQMDASHSIGFDYLRPSRDSKKSGPMDQADPVKSSVKQTGTVTNTKRFEQSVENPVASEEETLKTLQKELVEVRRYAESLHAAVYGEVEAFSTHQPGVLLSSNEDRSDYGSSGNGQASSSTTIQKSALQDWERRLEAASDADLIRLDQYYRSMRLRLKEILFGRRTDEWCRRCMAAMNSSGIPVEPPTMREIYSTTSTSSTDGPGEVAISKSGIHGNRDELLPAAAVSASIAEFRLLTGRPR
uniref:Uncharacterized protein n=1 Tax=Physcomitrium patens TaxID=3218 RepID=A0A2K1KBH2_PHYPA|nr:hypothetical protein PHYPA_010305 [Physcomitrium patens]